MRRTRSPCRWGHPILFRRRVAKSRGGSWAGHDDETAGDLEELMRVTASNGGWCQGG